ncbi:hypothetical protein F7725_003889 [Dissostichus mawsoni]|uniref:Uncharacterized protein n=1 Tax=Dissostichus mawsoni TaxID=36200 RepID=A0A7J5YCU2_DISMA|nr:hypothetical protein F7725_003889 [Dissostichus mawsoni]
MRTETTNSPSSTIRREIHQQTSPTCTTISSSNSIHTSVPKTRSRQCSPTKRTESYDRVQPSKDTSSRDIDPDKDASTDDEETPISSLSDMGNYQQLTGIPQIQGREPVGEVKGTALPHKLRLKHRAMSTGSSGGSGQESPTTPSSATPPPLPQHPYLSLLPQQNTKRESPVGGLKQAEAGKKKETGGRRNKRRD